MRFLLPMITLPQILVYVRASGGFARYYLHWKFLNLEMNFPLCFGNLSLLTTSIAYMSLVLKKWQQYKRLLLYITVGIGAYMVRRQKIGTYRKSKLGKRKFLSTYRKFTNCPLKFETHLKARRQQEIERHWQKKMSLCRQII